TTEPARRGSAGGFQQAAAHRGDPGEIARTGPCPWSGHLDSLLVRRRRGELDRRPRRHALAPAPAAAPGRRAGPGGTTIAAHGAHRHPRAFRAVAWLPRRR